MKYSQSGCFAPRYSNAAQLEQNLSETVSETIKPVEEITGGTTTSETTTTTAATKPAAKPAAPCGNVADCAFFYARQYWWAVAIASFLLGMWYKRKG